MLTEQKDLAFAPQSPFLLLQSSVDGSAPLLLLHLLRVVADAVAHLNRLIGVQTDHWPIRPRTGETAIRSANPRGVVRVKWSRVKPIG